MHFENNIGGYRKKITDETIVKYGEKAFSIKDEEIQFTPKAKIEAYYLYRTTRLPFSYKDFPNTPYKIIDATKKWYQDEVEPNTQYYYYLMGVTAAGILSDESYPLKVKIYDEDGAIYGRIEGLDFEREKEKRDKKLKTTLTTRSFKTKRFKRLVRIAPAFLQGAPNPSGDNEYIGYVKQESGIKGIDKRLWSVPKETLDPHLDLPTGLTIKPKFKFRIRSLKSRRKFDINILYTVETKHQAIIPASAEKVYEGPQQKCKKNDECPAGHNCVAKTGTCVKAKVGETVIIGGAEYTKTACKHNDELKMSGNGCNFNEDCCSGVCKGQKCFGNEPLLGDVGQFDLCKDDTACPKGKKCSFGKCV
jgi:hypothetical protein